MKVETVYVCEKEKFKDLLKRKKQIRKIRFLLEYTKQSENEKQGCI
jgi:hypothetical protein